MALLCLINNKNKTKIVYFILLSYIFLPFVKSDNILVKCGGRFVSKLIGSALCFSFVYIWHGASPAVVNGFEVREINFHIFLSNISAVNTFLRSVLSFSCFNTLISIIVVHEYCKVSENPKVFPTALFIAYIECNSGISILKELL